MNQRPSSDSARALLCRRVLPLLLAFTCGAALAHGGAGPSIPVPRELAPAPASPRDPPMADLKFAEMFRMPVGPLGLQPSEKLIALDGARVRMVGYMAGTERPVAGSLILTPLPVRLGDEDESLSDDLPASAVFVHLTGASAQFRPPNLGGLLQLSGTLRVGAHEEPDGHVSTVRLVLDEGASRRFVQAITRTGARPPAKAPH